MTTTDAADSLTAVRAAPRFRGWWMLGWCTLTLGLTAPGQTVGVSVLIDDLISGLGLSRSAVSAAYLVGTIAGALALPAIGRWIVVAALTALVKPPRSEAATAA